MWVLKGKPGGWTDKLKQVSESGEGGGRASKMIPRYTPLEGQKCCNGGSADPGRRGCGQTGLELHFGYTKLENILDLQEEKPLGN